MHFNKVLALAPPSDDAEIGCGGTLARFLDEGKQLFVVAFSTAEESLPPGSARHKLRDEFLEAMDILGVPEDHVRVYGYPVRRLPESRQEVLEELIRIKAEFAPDTVFLPSGNDMHQDHQVIFNEGLRAFKEFTIWGYDLPWNHLAFSDTAFVTLEERHLEKKLEVLSAYKSQIELKRPYFRREAVYAQARMRGLQVKAEFAEVFEVVRIKI